MLLDRPMLLLLLVLLLRHHHHHPRPSHPMSNNCSARPARVSGPRFALLLLDPCQRLCPALLLLMLLLSPSR